MVLLKSVDILGLFIGLQQIHCQFVYNMDSCTNVTFHRRSDMDDLVFAGSLIEEINQVDVRAECFSQCQWRAVCNLVLYNPLSRTCRLLSEGLNSSSEVVFESGWQYYGVACDDYRLANSREDVDVIDTDPAEMCNSSFLTKSDNSSSCFRGAFWKTVKIKCLPCYSLAARPSMDPAASYTEDVDFDLDVGMTLKLSVSGSETIFNHVWLMLPNQDVIYLLSLRWDFPNVGLFKIIFNTRQGNAWGAEFRTDFIPNSSANYVIEISITETSFLTYVDGTLWMTNPIRFPLSGVRRIELDGFTALHEFNIGKGMC
ncbi:uncharacterized protein [Haliotis cracherodii]|uniref:uncharacterized protein n=1 Tax=Haliotis cracherodii TaxID=6455 RepID=UPI0039EBC9C8